MYLGPTKGNLRVINLRKQTINKMAKQKTQAKSNQNYLNNIWGITFFWTTSKCLTFLLKNQQKTNTIKS